MTRAASEAIWHRRAPSKKSGELRTSMVNGPFSLQGLSRVSPHHEEAQSTAAGGQAEHLSWIATCPVFFGEERRLGRGGIDPPIIRSGHLHMAAQSRRWIGGWRLKR